jgi:cold shock CspA family protein
MSTTQTTNTIRVTGQVKWFNNKTGYGFITSREGEHEGKDVFTHYSSIRVTDSQYKYLVQGEYVEFEVIKSTTGEHEYQSADVSGIKGGSLMCETRQQNQAGDKPVRKYKTRPNRRDETNEANEE